MPFPFLFLALSLASGILLSSLLSFSLLMWILSLLASLFFAWLFFLFRKERQAFLFILLATFLFGASLYSLANKNYDENSLHKLSLSGYADFYGTLYKSPSRGTDRDFLFLRVKKVFYENKEQKIRGNLRITVPHSSESSSSLTLFVHDKIKVSARLLSSKGFRNFKASSLNAYLKSQNIHKRAFTKRSPEKGILPCTWYLWFGTNFSIKSKIIFPLKHGLFLLRELFSKHSSWGKEQEWILPSPNLSRRQEYITFSLFLELTLQLFLSFFSLF
jgi:hypothetical protein